MPQNLSLMLGDNTCNAHWFPTKNSNAIFWLHSPFQTRIILNPCICKIVGVLGLIQTDPCFKCKLFALSSMHWIPATCGYHSAPLRTHNSLYKTHSQGISWESVPAQYHFQRTTVNIHRVLKENILVTKPVTLKLRDQNYRNILCVNFRSEYIYGKNYGKN